MTSRDQTARVQPDESHGVPPAQYRLPEATHVGAVHLRVADLERSTRYYTEMLGLAVLNASSDAAVLGAGDTGEPLVRLYASPGIAPAPSGGRFGLYHFAMLLPDRAALGRFAAHVLRSGVRPGMADHAVSEALYLRDPDGLGIEVYADRPRSTWVARGGELWMTTEPLDVENLIAAGGGEPWTAAPEGTTMGHVHLHVGELNWADAFYRAALGFDKRVWSYPGALFFSAGGYHHHLGTNIWSRGPAPQANEAALREWELVVPTREDAAAAADSVSGAGHPVEESRDGWRTADPWGTRLLIRAER